MSISAVEKQCNDIFEWAFLHELRKHFSIRNFCSLITEELSVRYHICIAVCKLAFCCHVMWCFVYKMH
ncbi:hypothetical protein RIF29_24151 [Crotalaria pallida]|uniref:Uncharacterized protein n=1 Tax=Crotalaria pallida TaxID=3830 RepID=A0AAN9ELN6_CROPI